ncbi:hypothetical protein CLV35_3740 [Motilibacter peucedani]|uniref:Uncharacterized protein n=1 Tax=Motilibacter peucedani TaxID=598650 RepID=A0A420XKJ9_9ACTN|nr:hypothetical protein [Motilibacter peucedani]RKS68609.1 hypothetical protein CLV35_3740 [Motilibacter peucedani]
MPVALGRTDAAAEPVFVAVRAWRLPSVPVSDTADEGAKPVAETATDEPRQTRDELACAAEPSDTQALAMPPVVSAKPTPSTELTRTLRMSLSPHSRHGPAGTSCRR